jgi:hypothetical protein
MVQGQRLRKLLITNNRSLIPVFMPSQSLEDRKQSMGVKKHFILGPFGNFRF